MPTLSRSAVRSGNALLRLSFISRRTCVQRNIASLHWRRSASLGAISLGDVVTLTKDTGNLPFDNRETGS